MYIDISTLLAVLMLLLLAGGLWFWSDNLASRERMTEACARICLEMQLQFLDETVALARLRLMRTNSGWLQFKRLYVFEFSKSGSDRWKGRALLTGRRVESVQLDNPQGVTILTGAAPASADIISSSYGGSAGEERKHLH